MYTEEECPDCSGTGEFDGKECKTCGGMGTIETMLPERVTVELARDEWIALLISAHWGANEIENRFGGSLAGTAERLIEQISQDLRIQDIQSLNREAEQLSARLVAEDKQEEYRALFKDMATYRAPDGALLLATWTGNMPATPAHPIATWTLAPGNEGGRVWYYEVEPSGAIVKYHEGGGKNATDLTPADFVRAE